MVCANPDVVVERGDKLVYCAGAIADLYATMGGEVLYAGKPYRPIYDLALAKAQAAAGRTARSAACWRSAIRCAPILKARARARRRLPVRDRRHSRRGTGRPRAARRDALNATFAAAGGMPKAVMRAVGVVRS